MKEFLRLYILFYLGIFMVGTIYSQQINHSSINALGGYNPTLKFLYSFGASFKSNLSTDSTGNFNITHGFPHPFNQQGGYALGDIPDFSVGINQSTEFFVYSKNLGNEAVMEMSISDAVYGDISFSGFNGYFSYSWHESDKKPFTVQFTATSGNNMEQQSITISPVNTPLPEPASFFGITEGQFNVSETGQVSYSIPIVVSPGTGGMEPKLNLQYNGGSGNGILGIGWTLGGLSTISRSPHTFDDDFEIDPINFNDKSDQLGDRLNIDGQRLIGLGEKYGGNDSKHYTQINSFQEITSFRPNGFTSNFEVKTKSGLIKEYGNTNDSRIEAGRTAAGKIVMFWAVNKITDSNGNYMTYHYHEDEITKEFYPMEIRYTANDNMGLQAYNKVLFEYEGRNDISSRYVHGYQIVRTKRLKKISCIYNVGQEEQIVREYKFTYADGVQSKLLKMEEFGLGGETGKDNQLAPVEFDWRANTLFNLRKYSAGINKAELDTSKNGNQQVIPGDFNKDGYTDLLLYNSKTGSNKWLLNKGKLQFNENVSSIPQELIKGGDGIVLSDVNGDGINDVVWWDKVTGENNWITLSVEGSQIKFSSTNNVINALELKVDTSKYSAQLLFNDYNGDGLTDFIHFNDTLGELKLFLNALVLSTGQLDFSTGVLSTIQSADIELLKKSTIYTGDWNADGLTDLMAWNYKTGENTWLLNSGTVEQTSIKFEDGKRTISVAENLGNGRIYFGEFNGDGVTDLLWYNQETGENKWFINKGNYAFETPPHTNIIKPDEIRFDKDNPAVLQLNDFNADGLTDVMVINVGTGTVKFFTNKGIQNTGNDLVLTNTPLQMDLNNHLLKITNQYHGNEYEVYANKKPEDYLRFVMGDWLGTGNAGMMWYNPKDGDNHWFVNNVSRHTHLQAIREASRSYQVEYKSAVDRSVYAKHQDGKYPLVDLISPMQVVSKYSISNGLGGYNSFSYFYEGGKISLTGRGFIGYKKVTVSDNQTGIQSVNEFNHQIEYAGASLSKSYTLTRGLDTLSVNTFKQDYKSLKSSYYSFISKHRNRKYELNGDLVSDITTYKDFDDYGNLTQSIIDYSAGFRDTVRNSFYNNIQDDQWLLGRLTQSTVSRTVPDRPTERRVSKFEYDLKTGLLKTETKFAGIDSLQTTKNYTYDGYGNILTSTLSGFDGSKIVQRKTTTEYSKDGRFVVKKINPIGHTESREYIQSIGLLSETTNANGLTVNYGQDKIGRTVYQENPDGTYTKSEYFWATDNNLNGNKPTNAFYAKRKQVNDFNNYQIAPLQIVWFDKVGRQIRIEAQGFDGTHVMVDQVYNANGDLIQVSEPYFAGDQPIWNSYEYDLFNRVIKKTEPGNRIATVQYAGLVTSYMNPLGQKKRVTKDIMGRMIQSEDHLGNKINYSYNSMGDLIKISDPEGNDIKMEYDLAGNRIKLDDPDIGVLHSKYDAFGFLISQTDALNQTVQFRYDILGRTIERIEPEGVTKWEYDLSPVGIGALSKINAPNGFEKTYTYDELGRTSETIETISGKQYELKNNYNTSGKLSKQTYPTGFAVEYMYNATGFLEKVKNADKDLIYWQANSMNARGQLEQLTLGNGLQTTYQYDFNTGNIRSLYSRSSGNPIQELDYQFDKVGNLTQRKDLTRGLKEEFEYDDLNRLLEAKVEGGTTLSMKYDALGNIIYKSDVGEYSYGEGNAGPHAVTSINGDGIENTRFITSLKGSIQYTSFNKAHSVIADNRKVEIEYGYDRGRDVLWSYVNDTLLSTKTYVGNAYEEEIKGDTLTKTHLIRALGQVVATYSIDNNNKEETQYLHRDHIGSIQSITDESGVVVNTLSFDAWGNPRNANTWGATDRTITYHRGFTGHEHLDLVDLIHMNGRIYDPVIGRFTSPDPFIQDPSNLQSLNRYAYVINNPLTLSDPSGYFSWNPIKDIAKGVSNITREVFNGVDNVVNTTAGAVNDVGREAAHFYEKNKQTVDAVVVVALTVYTGGAASSLMGGGFLGAVGGGFVGGFVGGFTGAKIAGASDAMALQIGFKRGVVSGVSAGLTYGVGEAYALDGSTTAARHATDASNVVQKSIAHGVVQGAVSKAQGGKFEHGFVSGSLGNVADMSVFDTNNMLLDIMKSGVTGGVSAELAGGNFQSGAEQAMTVAVYNKFGGSIFSKLKRAILSGGVIGGTIGGLALGPAGALVGASAGAVASVYQEWDNIVGDFGGDKVDFFDQTLDNFEDGMNNNWSNDEFIRKQNQNIRDNLDPIEASAVYNYNY